MSDGGRHVDNDSLVGGGGDWDGETTPGRQRLDVRCDVIPGSAKSSPLVSKTLPFTQATPFPTRETLHGSCKAWLARADLIHDG